MDLKDVPDVSSFFLVESSGDSETEFDHNIATITDDDAESCISGYPDTENQQNHGQDEEGSDDEDDSSTVMDSRRDCQKIGSENLEKKDDQTTIDIGSMGEKMNEEEEKNKLFWETCLSLGF